MLHIGDRIYFKPFNCLLDIGYTNGIYDRPRYQEFENNTYVVVYNDSSNFRSRHTNMTRSNYDNWNFNHKVIDKNRKVV